MGCHREHVCSSTHHFFTFYFYSRYLKDSEKLLSYHLRKLDSAVSLPLVRLQDMQEKISTLLEVTKAAMPKVNGHRDEDLAGVCDNLEIVYDEVVLKDEDADKVCNDESLQQNRFCTSMSSEP